MKAGNVSSAKCKWLWGILDGTEWRGVIPTFSPADLFVAARRHCTIFGSWTSQQARVDVRLRASPAGVRTCQQRSRALKIDEHNHLEYTCTCTRPRTSHAHFRTNAHEHTRKGARASHSRASHTYTHTYARKRTAPAHHTHTHASAPTHATHARNHKCSFYLNPNHGSTNKTRRQQ